MARQSYLTVHFALDRLIINNLTDGNAAHLATDDTLVPTDAGRRVMEADGQLTGQVSTFSETRSLQSQTTISAAALHC